MAQPNENNHREKTVYKHFKPKLKSVAGDVGEFIIKAFIHRLGELAQRVLGAARPAAQNHLSSRFHKSQSVPANRTVHPIFFHISISCCFIFFDFYTLSSYFLQSIASIIQGTHIWIGDIGVGGLQIKCGYPVYYLFLAIDFRKLIQHAELVTGSKLEIFYDLRFHERNDS